MEDVRNVLCKIYEESSGKKPAAHLILASVEEEKKNVTQTEQLRKESSQCVMNLKRKLEQRQQLLDKQQQVKNTEVATLSQEIRNEFIKFDKIIEVIDRAASAAGQNIKGKKAEEAKKNFEELEKLATLMRSTRDRLKKWEEARQQNSNQTYNPMFKIADQVSEPVKLGKKQAVIAQNVNKVQSLEDLLPEFANIDDAVAQVAQQDEELESQAARMIEKVKIIQKQVLKHKEIIDQQDEILQDVEKNMAEAKDGLAKNNVTAVDIRKRLMKGDKCLGISIVVMICCVAAYWIYKLAFK
ncbi:Conserved_hypothetical protein [Hexamita inflata]|uniref:t-SNARE coiled-coil homology domain-containing protein n=1 Tax=Hexamita inflata TaxID=28002 RepID=A0AA86RDY0_9EUKA|nr:Conserved hypothetical protein [Hexamita inflata]